MTAAIPASQLVNVLPGVISAGGTALALNGLLLTNSTRVPIGSVLSFPDQASVAAYFGGASQEAAEAAVYFAGFDNSTLKPGAMLFAQYPTNTLGVAAYLRGGSLATMTLAQLQALPAATMTVTVNGVVKTSASINLAAAASFSAAAATMQTAFAAFDAVTTAAIAASTFSTTASVAGTIMTVTAVGSGTVVAGAVISGTGVTTSTKVLRQLSGTTGGVGTYQVDTSQTVSSTTVSGAYGTMTVSAVASGALGIGQVVSGTGVTVGTTIYQFGTGTGGTGTYFVSPSQTASSTTISAGPLSVTYDSTASAFVITGGTTGAASTIGFASSALATSLKLTAVTGATTSQGAVLGVPSTNMDAIVAQTQSWAGFTTSFEPSAADKVLFAAWTNGKASRYVYAMWETDINATTAQNSAAMLQIIAAAYGGVVPLYAPTDQYLGAMFLGFMASIDFARVGGRITFAFKSQSGMAASVTDAAIATQLDANGFNFYGSYASATAGFVFLYPGSITGPFLWADSFANEIWLNAAFQAALLVLLTNTRSIPYNPAGYARIDAALLDPINAAVNFGAIRSGVTLSAAQIAAANAGAGFDVSSILQTRGWYLQILDPGATVRAARGTPVMTFWYTDGQSVQAITLASLEIQ